MNRSTLISLLDEKIKIGNAQLVRITEHPQEEFKITAKIWGHKDIKAKLKADLLESGEEWSFDTCSLDQEEHECLIGYGLERFSRCTKPESKEKWSTVIAQLSFHYT